MDQKRKTSNRPDTTLLQGLGKLPPQAIDLEEAVLGACMLDKDAFSTAKEILVADAFYKDAHRMIFEAIDDLNSALLPADILTVTNQLKKKEQLHLVGGPYFITQLTNRVAGASNIEYHCRIILQKYFAREIIRESMEMNKAAYEDSADEMQILDNAGRTIEKLLQHILSTKEVNFNNQVKATYDIVRIAKESGKHIYGLETGFPLQDLTTSGRCNGELIISAARPSMGKSTRMLQEIYNISVINDVPVGLFSLEMPFDKLIIKIFANQTAIDSRVIQTGKLNDEEMYRLAKATEDLMRKKIRINDTASLHINQIRAQAKLWKKKYGIKALYVDYLQLVKGDVKEYGGNRDQEIGTISRGLKQIAKDCNIPVIALSQLSRGVDSRNDKRPVLGDLRESGNIEQDADVVEFLYRPDYYVKPGDPCYDEANNDVRGLVEIITAKNRNGGLNRTYCHFQQNISRMEEIDPVKYHSGVRDKKKQPYEPNYLVRDPTEGRVENKMIDKTRWDNGDMDDEPF